MAGRLFKRGNIWHGWVRDGDSGLLVRRSTKCTDRRAAEQWIAKLEREYADPANATARKTLLGKVLDDYLRSRERMNRAAETIWFVEKKSGHLLRLLPGRASTITHKTLESYIDTRREEGARNTTILKELRIFRAAWTLGLRNGLVRVHPDAIMPQLDDDAEARERFPTPWEMVGLKMVLPDHRMAQCAWMTACGGEWQAVGRARPEDVSEDRYEVHVRGRKRKARDRIAILSLPEQRSLMDWAVKHADGGIGGRLFSAWTNVRNDISRACERLGIARLSPNDFRRAYGSWLRAAGAAPQVIGAAMGHKDSRMVERVYGRLPPDALRKLLLQQTNDDGESQ